ncbi:UDP-glucosyltransferase 2-like [Pieris brassicae]|uniref:UDP-glucosyltransferase 2-like n=1 Tax=Pieris brassicae TaxID=7116 RepID=UPI001E660995|nr:UDP-glucosyltransferase 2-like [Pieris brassicae]
MMIKSTVLFNIILSFSQINTARILAIFPTPSISHQVVFRPLTQELARRGHEVIVITADPVFTKDSRPKNLTEIDVHDISYNAWRDGLDERDTGFGKKTGVFKLVKNMEDFFKEMLELQVNTEEIHALLNGDSKFDLLIIEACVRPALMYSHKFKVPVIQISSFGFMLGNDEVIGALTHPILFPIIMRQRVFNLTFWEKLYELYLHYWIIYHWHMSETREHEVLSKYFGSNVPSYKELNNNIDMLFLNIHPIWTNNQPLPPNVISIWGIHKNQEKPLPQAIQEYMDSSKNGVLYFSLGSNAQSTMLHSDTINTLIDVFSQLPYNVLWKWEKDELPGISKNIKISKWLPQTDLLRHPNLKLFITQGGLQSTDEAINSGVPLIGIPMLADQWYNVEFYEHLKIGIGLDIETITREKLLKAIETVISDKSYKENILKLRNILNDQPQSALDRAVWWTEYVLRYGGAKHFRAASANLSWFEFYEVEFMLKLLMLIFTTIVVLIITSHLVYRRLRCFIYSHKFEVTQDKKQI